MKQTVSNRDVSFENLCKINVAIVGENIKLKQKISRLIYNVGWLELRVNTCKAELEVSTRELNLIVKDETNKRVKKLIIDNERLERDLKFVKDENLDPRSQLDIESTIERKLEDAECIAKKSDEDALEHKRIHEKLKNNKRSKENYQ